MEKINEIFKQFEEDLKKDIGIGSLEKFKIDLDSMNELIIQISEKKKEITGIDDKTESDVSFEAYLESISGDVNKIYEKFGNLIQLTKSMETDVALKEFLGQKFDEIFNAMSKAASKQFNLSNFEIFTDMANELKGEMEEKLTGRIDEELFTIKDGFGEVQKIYEIVDNQFSSIQQFISNISKKYQNQLGTMKIIEKNISSLNTIFKQLMQDNEVIKKELDEHLSDLRQHQLKLLTDIRTEVDTYANTVATEKSQLKKEQQKLMISVEELSKQLEISGTESQSFIEQIKKMKQENVEMKAELDKVSEELDKVTAEFDVLSKEKNRKVERTEILALLMTLLVEVFGAQPHSKILFLLHGQKGEMDRNEIMKASGIAGAVVRHALADLNSAKLVDYDVVSGRVKLLKRIYE
ncbi:MAG: hypothetical protein ACTSRC_16015 [Candidatus Helarchaeota archaeon]